jgi:hypothetical protein
MPFPPQTRAVGRKFVVQRVTDTGHRLGQLYHCKKSGGGARGKNKPWFAELPPESSEKFPWSTAKNERLG